MDDFCRRGWPVSITNQALLKSITSALWQTLWLLRTLVVMVLNGVHRRLCNVAMQNKNCDHWRLTRLLVVDYWKSVNYFWEEIKKSINWNDYILSGQFVHHTGKTKKNLCTTKNWNDFAYLKYLPLNFFGSSTVMIINITNPCRKHLIKTTFYVQLSWYIYWRETFFFSSSSSSILH